MWRFIIVSFAFLGWSFYELSGGSDYRPSANSIQTRALLDNQRPVARPLRVNVIELARNGAPRHDAEVTRTITSLHDLGLTMGEKVVLTPGIRQFGQSAHRTRYRLWPHRQPQARHRSDRAQRPRRRLDQAAGGRNGAHWLDGGNHAHAGRRLGLASRRATRHKVGHDRTLHPDHRLFFGHRL